MTKCKKIISTVVAAAISISCISVFAVAAEYYQNSTKFDVGTAEGTGDLLVSGTVGSASTSLNVNGGSVEVKIYGEYYSVNAGSFLSTGNGGTGTTGVTASISRASNGYWRTVNATYTGWYNHETGSGYLSKNF